MHLLLSNFNWGVYVHLAVVYVHLAPVYVHHSSRRAEVQFHFCFIFENTFLQFVFICKNNAKYLQEKKKNAKS